MAVTKEDMGILAKAIVEEVPVTQLRRFLDNIQPGADVSKGDWCGGDCGHTGGKRCGLKCEIPDFGSDVIDPEGRLGFTVEEIGEVRKRLPEVRNLVVKELQETAVRYASMWK